MIGYWDWRPPGQRKTVGPARLDLWLAPHHPVVQHAYDRTEDKYIHLFANATTLAHSLEETVRRGEARARLASTERYGR
jgi:hypothetical protein